MSIKTVLDDQIDFLLKFKPAYTHFIIAQESVQDNQSIIEFDSKAKFDSTHNDTVVLHEVSGYWDATYDDRIKTVGVTTNRRFGNALDEFNAIYTSAYNETYGIIPKVTMLANPGYLSPNPTKFRWDHGINNNIRGQFGVDIMYWDKQVRRRHSFNYDDGYNYDDNNFYDGNKGMNKVGWIFISGTLVIGTATLFQTIGTDPGDTLRITSGPSAGTDLTVASVISDNVLYVTTPLNVATGTNYLLIANP